MTLINKNCIHTVLMRKKNKIQKKCYFYNKIQPPPPVHGLTVTSQNIRVDSEQGYSVEVG